MVAYAHIGKGAVVMINKNDGGRAMNQIFGSSRSSTTGPTIRTGNNRGDQIVSSRAKSRDPVVLAKGYATGWKARPRPRCGLRYGLDSAALRSE